MDDEPYEAFSRRRQKMFGESTPLEELPTTVRNQAIGILRKALGEYRHFGPYPNRDRAPLANHAWEEIHEFTAQELGMLELARGPDPQKQCERFLLSASTSQALDLIEVAFLRVSMIPSGMADWALKENGITQRPADAIAELNHRFKSADLPYRVDGLLVEDTKGSTVPIPALQITTETVERALSDAETLIRTRGATSGADRVHTALHGYLQELCVKSGIKHADDATIAALFKALQQQHRALVPSGPRRDDIGKAARALAVVMDVLGPLRNSATLAHPSPRLLEEPEAMLVINAARTILHYIDAKVSPRRKPAMPPT